MESVIHNLTFDTRLSNNKSLNAPLFFDNNFNLDELLGFQVESLMFVNTIPNITSRNNKLSLIENGATTATLLTLQEGNYTIDTFKTMLENSLTASAGNTYSVGLNTMENLLSIATTLTSASFVFGDTLNNVYYELGVENTGANLITAPYDLSGLKTLCVVSSDLSSGYVKTMGSNYNIILKVPVSNSYASTIHYQNNSSVFKSSDLKNVRSFGFTLYDERMRLLDEKYLKDWVLTLNLETS